MKLKKIISAVLAILMLLIAIPSSVYALDNDPDFPQWGEGDSLEGETGEIKVGFDSDHLLNWLFISGYGIAKQRYTYFQFKNADGSIEEHPVYCIDPHKPGAYEVVRDIGANPDDESDTATYVFTKGSIDSRFIGILAMGWPHMRLSSIGLNGVETNEEGYYATKVALWLVIRRKTPGDLSPNPAYTGDPAVQRVLDAVETIYAFICFLLARFIGPSCISPMLCKDRPRP
jgi:hypothetical protein